MTHKARTGMATRTTMAIADIRMDGGTQPRATLDFEAIEDYCDAMAAGVKFPAVEVFYDGENYWLVDGFHRVKAAFASGSDVIECEIYQGTLEEAQWYSFSANKTSGLRRTNQDKQRAVKAALQHPSGVELSDRLIGRHVGVDHQTVANWRRKLAASGEIRQIATRTVTRGEQTYQQSIPKPAGADTRRTKDPFEALRKALRTITNCSENTEELALHLAARADRAEILNSMEKAYEFLELFASQVRRAEPSGSSQATSEPGNATCPGAGYAGTSPAVAEAEQTQPPAQ